MTDTLSLSIRNDVKEVANAFRPVDEFLGSKGLTPRTRNAANLVIEELLINIITYAYKDKKEHTIDVKIEINEEKVAITLQDDGIAFNPLSVPRPDRSKPVMERLEKGLGINLVRSMRKAMEYHRDDDKNILKVWIKV